jgi:hypothetical protein
MHPLDRPSRSFVSLQFLFVIQVTTMSPKPEVYRAAKGDKVATVPVPVRPAAVPVEIQKLVSDHSKAPRF